MSKTGIAFRDGRVVLISDSTDSFLQEKRIKNDNPNKATILNTGYLFINSVGLDLGINYSKLKY